MYTYCMLKPNPVSTRLSETGRRILDALKAKKGVTGTAVIEMAIREMAEREGVKVESETE